VPVRRTVQKAINTVILRFLEDVEMFQTKAGESVRQRPQITEIQGTRELTYGYDRRGKSLVLILVLTRAHCRLQNVAARRHETP
jgi:hypothetical protein